MHLFAVITSIIIQLFNLKPIPPQTTTLTPTPTITPTPTPKPLTFTEINNLYGPCTYLPVLYYHHIQDMNLAQKDGHANLTVDTNIFRSQIQYLHDRGYTAIDPESLINFFDKNIPLPEKSVLITFDDGYDDFATDAIPVLRQFGYKSVVFIPTGLINNPGYLSWNIIDSLRNEVYFANHTWSHKANDSKDLAMAVSQLNDRGLDRLKVFAYPFGTIFPISNFSLAFTTRYGTYECKQQRLTLPRIRIGNVPLSNYGL